MQGRHGSQWRYQEHVSGSHEGDALAKATANNRNVHDKKAYARNTAP